MKIYCGIFEDGLEIKIAYVKKMGKKLSIKKIISVPSNNFEFSYNLNATEKNSNETVLEFNEFENNIQSHTNLTEIVEHFPLKDLKFIPVITEPQISYLVYNPNSTIKNYDIRKELKKLWKETTNIDHDEKKIDFIEYRNHSIISSVIQDEIPVVNDLKRLAAISETKSLDILSLRSGDISFINYVLRFYHPGKDETFLLVYIGLDSVRLIFIKEGKVIHINRYLSLSLERQGLISFLSSKIVLEMEYAGISEISNIILTGEVNDDLLSSFKQNFPFIMVDYLNLNFFNVNELSDDDKLKLQSFSFPLLAVIDEVFPFVEIRKNLEVHSKRLSKISIIKKIDFVSIILFIILIGLITFSIDNYLKRIKKLDNLKAQLLHIESLKSSSYEELKELDILSKRYETLNKYFLSINEFTKDRIWWTDELMSIHYFNPKKNKMWLTSIIINDQNPAQIILKGLMIDRKVIPDFMKILKNGELKNIYLYEIRGKKIFQFELTANIK